MNNKNMIMQSRITRKILLPYWKEFCDFNKANETAINSDQLSKLYRFRARHRLATKLVSIHAEGFSEQTLRGYTAALKLMFAYSAAEILGNVLDKHPVTQWEIIEPRLALSLRGVLNRAGASKNTFFSSELLKSHLNNFLKGTTDDVRIAATALRVMVAHGSFTPSGTDSLTIKGSQTVWQLADLMLKIAETHFADYVVKSVTVTVSPTILPLTNLD